MFARRLHAPPAATHHDKHHARAGVLGARLVCSHEWKEQAGVVGAVLQDAVQQPAIDPEAYAIFRARRGTVRRVKVGGRGHATYLIAPVTMIMVAHDWLEWTW